jgi:hypothetical protein
MDYESGDDLPDWAETIEGADAADLEAQLPGRFGQAGEAMAQMMDEDPYFREMVSMCHTSEGGAAMWETLFTEGMDPDEDLVMVESFLERVARTAKRVILRKGHLTARGARRLLREMAEEEGLEV